VHLEQVDVVRPQPAQRVLQRAGEPTPGVSLLVGVVAIGRWALVASTTLSRRPLRAFPTISSDSPRE
jgi:hypothetical protein